MPSFSGTPGQIYWNGGEATFSPPRFSGTAARILWTGGTGAFLIGNLVAAPVLNRLHRLMDKADGETDKQFQRRQQIWQTSMEAIETAFSSLIEQVNNNTQALTLAQAANSTAGEATDTISIVNSYPDPASVVTAANDGTVSIAAHDRVYGNGTRVSVDAGSVPGFASGQYVTIYYKDSGRTGGAVTYQGTTSAVAQQGSVHIVGQAVIPASGDPPATGTSPTGSGYAPPSGGETYDPDYLEP